MSCWGFVNCFGPSEAILFAKFMAVNVIIQVLFDLLAAWVLLNGASFVMTCLSVAKSLYLWFLCFQFSVNVHHVFNWLW